MQKLLLCLALLASLSLTSGCVPMAAVGAGTVAVIAGDRRTAGMYVEDENIEWKALARLKEKYPAAHVNPISYNRKVLLTGEALTEEMKKQLGDDVRSIPSVVEVVNEVQVAGASSLAARGNDGLITSNVKFRMVNNPKFSVNHIKVVTEAGTVYLMGLVSQSEGDAAAEIARTTSGVRGVVKVFEYTK
jgi:osmotically-inducible protein OsmY